MSSGSEALALAAGGGKSNLIITALNVGDMNAVELAREVKERGLDIPVVVLAYDSGELATFIAQYDTSDIDRLFLWQGDARILLAIVKYVEDRLNVERDTAVAGVQVILVVEDSIRYYSAFLPMVFTEVISHSQRLIPEGANVAHKILRMRARPKILLCTTWEEAWAAFSHYGEDVLGIISDIEFPREGELDPLAGVDFARGVKEAWPDVPVVLQSGRPENAELARQMGAAFLLKGSATLINDLRDVIVERFAFGDFVFRLPGGKRIARANDLKSLVEQLQTVPIESILFHASRNDFSRWLKARTEFALAARLRPRQLPDFRDAEAMRTDLIDTIEEYRRERYRALVADFDRDSFDTTSSFSRIGGGSLGGKARALAFVRHLLNTFEMFARFPGATVTVPPSVVLAADLFDEFLETNDLREFAVQTTDDAADRGTLSRGRVAVAGAGRPPFVPRADPLPAGRAVVEPAGGFAVPADGRALPYVHAAQRPSRYRRAVAPARADHQAGVRVDLLPAREAIPRGHPIPGRRGEDGGDHPEGGRRHPRNPLLPRPVGRRPFAQLLSVPAGGVRRRRGGGGAGAWAGPWSTGSRCGCSRRVIRSTC